MSEIGLEPVPAGRTANFHGTSDLQVTILAVYIATSVLATIGLVLRLYTGAFLVRNLGLDALFLVAAWAVYLASFIGMVKVMPCGFGKHLWSVTESGMACYKDMLLFLGVSYLWPPTLAKLSLVVLYHRINPSRTYRFILYAIAFVCTVFTVILTVLLAAPCNPLKPDTTMCLNNIALAQAILNISTDGVLILMPVVMLWNLQMPKKQKITVGFILVLASAAVIASGVRIAYVRAMISNPDFTYTQGSAAVWSAIEINLGILCNCLAMLKPFVRRHMPWLRSLIGSHSAGGYGRDQVRPGYNLSRVKKTTVQHRDRRESDGMYELYSVGRDRGFREDAVGTVGARVEAGRVSDDGNGSAEFGPVDVAKPAGILVTTTVAMGRSSEVDMSGSTDYILGRGGGKDLGVISTEPKIGERA